jgi:hypothetical protein
LRGEAAVLNAFRHHRADRALSAYLRTLFPPFLALSGYKLRFCICWAAIDSLVPVS